MKCFMDEDKLLDIILILITIIFISLAIFMSGKGEEVKLPKKEESDHNWKNNNNIFINNHIKYWSMYIFLIKRNDKTNFTYSTANCTNNKQTIYATIRKNKTKHFQEETQGL